MHWFGWPHTVWMTLWWLVGIALLVTLVWSIVLSASLRLRERESPEEILKREYAAGEIDTDEYTRRLEELQSNKRAA